MAKVSEELRPLLLRHKALDLSQIPFSLRVVDWNWWGIISGICLGLLALTQFVGIGEMGFLSSWDSLLGFALLFVSGTFLKDQLVYYEITIGPDDVTFSQTWLGKQITKWQVPLKQYTAIALNLFPLTNGRWAGFSVDLIHPDPEKSLPIAAALSRTPAKKQLEALQSILPLPIVDQTGTGKLQEAMSFRSSAWNFWSPKVTRSLRQGLIIGLLGLFVVWTRDTSSIESMVLLGFFAFIIFGALLHVFLIWILIILLRGKQFPFGVISFWKVGYKKITEPMKENRVRKVYQGERSRVCKLGFYDLCCVRLVLPKYSFLLSMGTYFGVRVCGHLTQIQHPWRLTILQPVLAFPGEATYACLNGREISVFTLFEDGTILRTSTHQKNGAYNFVDQSEKVYSSSTGSSIEETWRQHQNQIKHLHAEGKLTCQEGGFEEFVKIDTQVNETMDKYNWFQIE